jgi:hypothetical protein
MQIGICLTSGWLYSERSHARIGNLRPHWIEDGPNADRTYKYTKIMKAFT